MADFLKNLTLQDNWKILTVRAGQPAELGGGHSPQAVQNLEILITFLILRVERSDLVRISDKLFSKLKLDFETLTWIYWISRWSFVAFRGDSRWSYSIVNTTENRQSCPSSVWLQNSDRSHLQYLRDCCQGFRQFSMLVRSDWIRVPNSNKIGSPDGSM